MKLEKGIILVLAIGIGVIAILARLSLMGWLFMFGIGSFIIFGVLHTVLLVFMSAKYYAIESSDKYIGWALLALFPLIFLLQGDTAESGDGIFAYEVLFGISSCSCRDSAFQLAIGSGIVYVFLFIIFMQRTRNHHG